MLRASLPAARRALPAWCGAARLLCGQANGEAGISQASAEFLSNERAVLKLEGKDTFTFLQGMVTNDVDALRECQGPAAMYAAVLNPKGRFLHDAFFYRIPELGGTLLADVHRGSAEAVLRLLHRYRLRADVAIGDVSSEYRVATSPSPLQDPSVLGEGHVCWSFADPRLPELGFRSVVSTQAAEALPPEASAGSAAPLYRHLRMRLGVPEGDVEFGSGSGIPLEYNLGGLRAVNFAKGCYVGQELTARTHFQGVVRKRVVPIALGGGEGEWEGGVDGNEIESGMEDDEQGGPDVKVVDATSGKSVGKLVARSGCRGLALLRLNRLLDKDLRLGSGGGISLTTEIPGWWPEGWYESAQLH